MEDSLDQNRELPGHFLHELYKWALECELNKIEKHKKKFKKKFEIGIFSLLFLYSSSSSMQLYVVFLLIRV
jgi:hypothetical protein